MCRKGGGEDGDAPHHLRHKLVHLFLGSVCLNGNEKEARHRTGGRDLQLVALSDRHVGGKSTVSSILKEKGCHCIDCDKIGHRVYISETRFSLCIPSLTHTSRILLDLTALLPPSARELLPKTAALIVASSDPSCFQVQVGARLSCHCGSGNEEAHRHYVATDP